MNELTAEELVRLLLGHISPNSPPQDLYFCLASLAHDNGYVSNLNLAYELIEPLVPGVRSITTQMLNRAMQEGTAWKIELFGSDDEWIRGSSFHDPQLPGEDQLARARRAFVKDSKNALKTLSPREFEFACASVLKLLGCEDPHTTRHSADGGIDFYGRLELKGRLDSSFPYGGLDTRGRVWLIGQAKHYPNSELAPAVLREMVGTVELARTGSALQEWPGLDLRPFDASLILIFTTGELGPGARALLDKSGVLSMNGDQLATFLCDAGIGIDDSTGSFDLTSFRQELLGSRDN